MAVGAPSSKAPMPRIPFPAPKSNTPSSSSANVSCRSMPMSQQAAVSPSVAYCSSCGLWDGCLGSSDSRMAKCFCFQALRDAREVRGSRALRSAKPKAQSPRPSGEVFPAPADRCGRWCFRGTQCWARLPGEQALASIGETERPNIQRNREVTRPNGGLYVCVCPLATCWIILRRLYSETCGPQGPVHNMIHLLSYTAGCIHI